MSTTAIVFDPNGVARDIPYEQLQDLVQKGAVPAVNFQAPDGTIRPVPANRVKEAAQNGGKILPYQQQEVQHPGFWNALGDDLKGIAGSGYRTLKAGAEMYSAPEGFGTTAVTGLTNSIKQAQAEDAQRKAVGYPRWYRALAPIGELAGANVPGMEQSAAEGDVGGVAGHAAAVPVALAGTEALARAIPAAARTEVGAKMVRGAAKGVNTALARAPGSLGAAAGGALGYQLAGPVGAEIGGAAGFGAGREILPKLRIPGEEFGLPPDATGENKPYAGSTSPPPSGEPDATGQNDAYAGENSPPSLGDATDSVVAQHIPPDSATYQHYLQTKAEIDFHLKRGDVPAAEAALDKAASANNPNYQPPAGRTAPQEPLVSPKDESIQEKIRQTQPPELSEMETNIRKRAKLMEEKYPVGSFERIQDPFSTTTEEAPAPAQTQTQIPAMYSATEPISPRLPVSEVRARLQANPATPENLETHGIQQEMAGDLERHGYRAESEARREFIARNSTGATKGNLVDAAKPPESEDLAPEWQKTLDYLMKKKRGQAQ